MTTKCIFDGSIKALTRKLEEEIEDLLINKLQLVYEANDVLDMCEKMASILVHDNFKEKKSHVPKCSECGATCWSNNRTRGSKRICRKCYNKTKEENENVEEK